MRVASGTRPKPRLPPAALPPPVVRQLRLARLWQDDLRAGRVKNRSALAEREGVSGMWVTHVLRLLELHPELIAFIEGLPAGLPPRLVSGRELRRVGRQRHGVQLQLLSPGAPMRWCQRAA
jgi:hypothetical protein